MPSSRRHKSSSRSSSSNGGEDDAPPPPTERAISLREIVRRHLLTDVFEASGAAVQRSGAAAAGGSSWLVLVVDPESLRVVSSSVGMYNLMEHRVSIVEDLTKKRAPFRDQAVLYLVEPNEASVKRIVEDWTPTKGKKGPPYGDAVFLYFLGRLPDQLFGYIKTCKELVTRVKVLKEVNLDFLIKEASAFHFDMGKPDKDGTPSPLYRELYLKSGGGGGGSPGGPLSDRMISKLVTVCATLNEYPHVRYPAKNELCKDLAFSFQQKMNDFVGSNASWWYHGDGSHPNTERATLLLVDRKDDCLSPLVHEFTYEAMVRDLLDVDDDRITYESVGGKEGGGGGAEGGGGEGGGEGGGSSKMDALLNDNDEVWVELRGRHIADVIQTLSSKIRDIVNSSTGSALGGSAKQSGKALSVNQMAKALQALPEYREIMSKLSQHMQIAHQCMDAFNKQGLLDLSDLEQTLATGKTDEGRTPKLKELLGQVVEEFRKRPNDGATRLRLMAVAIVSQRGLSSQGDLEKLLREANLSQREMTALRNLEKMGCPLVNPEGKKNGKLARLRDQRVSSFGSSNLASESEYSSSRYVCPLKGVLEESANGKLSVEEYPSVMPLPDPDAVLGSSVIKSVRRPNESVRKTGSGGWAKASAAGQSAQGGKKKGRTGARQIVFVAGGACYSELRAAREVAVGAGTEVVMGSTRCVAPADFVGDLVGLGSG
ncbi:hypothetical protein ACHAWF_013347 [Thalassiosira exigua]